MEDYRIGPVADDCFDLFYIAEKQHKINDSGRIDIRRQSGKNHYKQQPESSSILSSFYPIQS